MSKKRSKYVAVGKKRKKRNKQRFWNRVIVPRIEARIEAKRRKEEARRKVSEELKKGLKKIEVIPKKTRKPQKKER